MEIPNTEFRECTGDFPEADTLLRLALDVGQGMLKSGGEIHRVEDTIGRICHAYGAEHTEIFAIPSLILAAIRMKDGAYSSQIRRVDSIDNHLHRLELYNEISRRICRETPPLCQVEEMIRDTKRKRTYPTWLRILGAAVSAGAFAMFFGGDWWDAVVSAMIGGVMYTIDLISIHQINRLAKTVLQSFIGGFFACLAMRLGLGHDMGAIMIGTIMVLIPGLAFGTAFRDLLCGDFLAGTWKTVQCVLAALMIAAGYLLAMLLVLGGEF